MCSRECRTLAMMQSVTSTTPGPAGPGAATRTASPYLAETISRPRSATSSARRRAASPAMSLRCSAAVAAAGGSSAAGAASSLAIVGCCGSLSEALVGGRCQRPSHQLAVARQQLRMRRRPSGGAAQSASARPSSAAGSGPAVSGQSSKGKLKFKPARHSVSLNDSPRCRTRIAQCSFVRPSRAAFVQVACRAQPCGETEGANFSEKSLLGLYFSCALSSPVPGCRLK
mmetsp:Transcript_68304/g.188995  ORF Transcript_68304/g.188995 Transcript_68304/m.188995 type:complete len:228 (+) Transcript_68304:282-965(+)